MDSKIVLTYYDVEDNIAEELVNADQIDELKFQVKNVPFFAPNISYDDIIAVENDEGILYFEELLEPSEHSTVQIVFFNLVEIPNVIKGIEELECNWEGFSEQTIIAIDIPPSIDYKMVKHYLDTKANEGVLDYKEACLSDTHKSNLS
ncbi:MULTISPECIES: DUF4265 domain-containing protein [Chryseobacterium]|uniref:DUF4265 domain-containing protein n=1 Tax=Chryseobacterium camelliae TaxID=1265445 RepID=A0ABU0TN79_9FLAO|nr:MULTISPECIES: DUF4265 domain-containing protein [Chryseobacterium]MDT3408461.1 hypothetical protein [Pseudacidovorax intermedius]MDQ1097683.1 hypothetical protein [Chryseobacterium camelliae]MDQ1101612.1 hypothetical protein [Chryseobacterium sp. SORGH_AS_1048]MDR6085055.1 hypothetical protein [Chryseobacterium sp. SORGH_AS_0909]MDR6129410.1 hypothetical protein [Chryseobacterium sp. SORGH_AS_1175]